MSESSNIERFAAGLERLKDIVDFTDGSGAVALDHIAAKIQSRAQSQSGSQGSWAENRGKYGQKKRTRGIPVGTGLRDESPRMLDEEQIRGRRTITEDEATMEAGTDDRSAAKASWFNDGVSERGQVARPFYEITEEDADEVRTIVADGVNRRLHGGL